MKCLSKQKISAALSVGLALSGLGLTGCVYERPHRAVVVVEAAPPPPTETVIVADQLPPDQDETAYIGYAPYPDAVWIRGHYAWREGQGCWVWMRGHWGRPPRYGAIWIRGHYDRRVWIEGYWR